MDFAKSICRFDQLIDGRQYQSSIETRRTAENHPRRMQINEQEENDEAEEQLNQQVGPGKKKKIFSPLSVSLFLYFVPYAQKWSPVSRSLGIDLDCI